MSKMLPPFPSPDVKSRAEIRVFELLRDDPDTENWIVLHSLALSRHVRNRYGEIDFVVLAPDWGIFCLEVKGGRLSSRDGLWNYTNRDGETTTNLKSPFLQARDGMFSLQEIVRERCEDGDRLAGLVYGYGVMFPDIEWDHADPEHESWQIYDRSFRAPVSGFIKGLARRSPDAAQGRRRPTASDIRMLKQALRPDFEYIVKPVQQITEAESALLVLTEDQYSVLDGLEGNARLVIEGGAGTGKTLLAIEAARRAASAGRKTLLLCFNRLLGRWIAENASKLPRADTIVAGNVHRIFETQFIARGSRAEEFEQRKADAMEQDDPERNRFFREDFSLYAFDAVTEGAVEPFDVLIIDEGQDLIRSEYLDVFDALLRGGLAGGRWIMFADFARQAIYADTTADEMRDELNRRGHFASYALRHNCRNTRPIALETALLSGFEAPPFLPSNVEGKSVDYQFWTSDLKQRKAIANIITRLLDDGLRPQEITILSPVRRENSCLKEPLSELPVGIVDLMEEMVTEPPSNAVLFATLHSYKGLENRAIIIIDIEHLSDEYNRQLLYVGMSRPRARLFMVISQKARVEYDAIVRKGLESSLGASR